MLLLQNLKRIPLAEILGAKATSPASSPSQRAPPTLPCRAVIAQLRKTLPTRLLSKIAIGNASCASVLQLVRELSTFVIAQLRKFVVIAQLRKRLPIHVRLCSKTAISPGPLAFRHFFFGGEARNTANLALLAWSLKLQYQHK